MSAETDYVVTDVRRTPGGWVTYLFTDGVGQRRHVTVPHHLSTPEHVDPVIRHRIATTAPIKVPT